MIIMVARRSFVYFFFKIKKQKPIYKQHSGTITTVNFSIK